jgi:hypothetical protein
MPNISTENRIVDICAISATPCGTSTSTVALDLSAGMTGSFGGSYSSATGIQTGDVAMYAWPQIVAENAATSPTGYTWMSPAGDPTAYTYTLEGLSDATPHIFYYPNSISAIITNSGEIRTEMQPVSGPTTYKSGDMIASVVRIGPSSLGNTMTVTANYATGSTYNLASCASSPCLDVEDTGLSFTVSSTGVATFTDKASGQTIVSPELTGSGLTSQTITFANPGTQTVGTPLTLSATATSGLTVTFTSTTPSICTVTGTAASFSAAGTCTIDANQAGNSTYAAAPMVPQSFTVNAHNVPSFTIAGTAVTITTPGATTGNTSTITVTPSGGFTGSVALTAAITGGPFNTSADAPQLSFGSTSPVTLSSAAAKTATLTISTTAANSAALAYPARPGIPWRSGGTALACILFFGLSVRRRWQTMLGLLVFAALLSGGVLSCGGGISGGGIGGGGNSGTVAGTYQVTVTATSGSVTAQSPINVLVQ